MFQNNPFEMLKRNGLLMASLKQTIKGLLVQTLLIFAGSFLWNLITGDSAYSALKEAFAVFLIALLALSVAEAAYNYQTK